MNKTSISSHWYQSDTHAHFGNDTWIDAPIILLSILLNLTYIKELPIKVKL